MDIDEENIFENSTSVKFFEISVYAVFEILIAFFAIIENFLVIFVFCVNKKLKTRIYYFVISLSVADFLVGAVAIPLAIVIKSNEVHDHHSCLFMISAILFIFGVSKLSVVSIALDRFYAISYPIAFHRDKEKSVPYISLFVSWFFGFLGGFILFAWYEESDECTFSSKRSHSFVHFRFTIITALPIIALIILYGLILRELKDFRRKRKVFANKNIRESIAVVENAKRRELQVTWNLSIIVFVFMLCWIPINIYNLINSLCDNCVKNSDVLHSLIVLSHLSSIINPLLYAYRLKDFREALFSMFRSMFKFS